MSTLDTLPPDLLALVLAKLYAADVRHLLITGSRRLSVNVSRSALQIVVEPLLDDIFPFFAFQLPLIRSIAISSEKKEIQTFMDTSKNRLAPSIGPWKRLEILRFDFWRSMDLVETSFDHLPHLFPQLRELLLRGTNKSAYTTFLQRNLLPKSIEKLSLYCDAGAASSGTQPTNQVTFDHISSLPDTLTHLLVHVGSIGLGEAKEQHWPPNLKTIDLEELESLVPLEYLVHLPLESLSVRLKATGPIQWRSSCLPRTLNRLHLQQSIIMTLDVPLPPNLTTIPEFLTMVVNGKAVDPYAGSWANWEETIGPYFPTGFPFLPYPGLGNAERQLTKVNWTNLKEVRLTRANVGDGDFNAKVVSLLRAVPKTVVSLSIGSILDLHTLPSSFEFPSTLTYLELTNLDANLAQKMPKTLRQFQFSIYSLKANETQYREILLAFPSELETLSVNHHLHEISMDLMALGRLSKLTTLRLDNCHSTTFSRFNAVLSLPLTLRNIHFRIKYGSPSFEWVEDLAHLSNLTTLSLTACDPHGLSRPHIAFLTLPRSLLHLKLKIPLLEPSTELRQLPPRLFLLMLDTRSFLAATPSDLAWTDDHVSNLPPTLLHLSFMAPQEEFKLTQNVLKVLPPRIAFLRLWPSPWENEANTLPLLEYYYTRHPRWNGWRPQTFCSEKDTRG